MVRLGSATGTQRPWIDVSSYIDAGFEIRFSIDGFQDAGERLFLDNVRVDLDCLCEGIVDAGIDITICQGDTTQLLGADGVGYSWSPSLGLSDSTIADPLAFPEVTTTFVLTVTDENGCTDTDEVTILVNESVEATAAELSTDLCLVGEGQAIVTVSQGNGPFTITWQSESGLESGTDILDNIGSYTIPDLTEGNTYCIEVVDANGCTVINP